MLKKIHDIPLLLLVVIAALIAAGAWAAGLSGLAAPIALGETYLLPSIAELAKDALFKPLKPLMYALIIMSIGSSIAISRGGLGAKFVRVIVFFVSFSLTGLVIAIVFYNLFSGLNILPDPASVGAGGSDLKQTPFLKKIYGVFTSELMMSIYAGVIFGQALKRLELGQQADKISDLFIYFIDGAHLASNGVYHIAYPKTRHWLCSARSLAASPCRLFNLKLYCHAACDSRSL